MPSKKRKRASGLPNLGDLVRLNEEWAGEQLRAQGRSSKGALAQVVCRGRGRGHGLLAPDDDTDDDATFTPGAWWVHVKFFPGIGGPLETGQVQLVAGDFTPSFTADKVIPPTFTLLTRDEADALRTHLPPVEGAETRPIHQGGGRTTVRRNIIRTHTNDPLSFHYESPFTRDRDAPKEGDYVVTELPPGWTQRVPQGDRQRNEEQAGGVAIVTQVTSRSVAGLDVIVQVDGRMLGSELPDAVWKANGIDFKPAIDYGVRIPPLSRVLRGSELQRYLQ
jgi:hypothetical protein